MIAPPEGGGDGPATDPAPDPVASLSLRPYQADAIEKMRTEARNGHRAICLVLPTGGGKTVVATAIILSHLSKRKDGAPKPHVLFVAHRTELITQATETLRKAGVPNVRTINGGKAKGLESPDVTVASVQTLAGVKWRDRLPPGVTMVVFDECHHVKAATWLALANEYRSAFTVGLTATPQRADGSALGDVFDSIVVVASVLQLVMLGFLVPCDVYAPTEEGKALAEDPVQAYQRWGGGRRCVVFAQSVAYARALAQQFTQSGVPAGYVDGTMPQDARDSQLLAFRRGDLRVMVNVNVLTEGWDDPGAEVCILARNPGHAGTFLQMVGRVLRIHPGKERATLIDLGGSVWKHGMPDDEREYSLDGEAISGAKVESCKQCKVCGYVGHPWRTACPRCGTVVEVEAKKVDIDGRELTLIHSGGGAPGESKKSATDKMRNFYLSMVEKCIATGKKLGHAWYKYREKFPGGPDFRKPKDAQARWDARWAPKPAHFPYDAPAQWECPVCRASYDDATRKRWMHATASAECEQCMIEAWDPGSEGAAQ